MRDRLPATDAASSLWRAVAVFRVIALLVCIYLIVRWQSSYAHPHRALIVGGTMTLVTVAAVLVAFTDRAHRPAIVAADLAVTAALTLTSIWVQTPAQRHGTMPTLTTIWAAAPVIESALVATWIGGLLAAAFQLGVSMVVRAGYDGRTLYNGFLLALTGVIIGYAAMQLDRSERLLAQATATRAALEERERLAREIHDDVLQVLALVHRKARATGGEWTPIAHSAAEAEVSLRGLATARITPARIAAAGTAEMGTDELIAGLQALNSAAVTVSVPSEPVPLLPRVSGELVAAVRAALHNVAQHAGPDARAWVFCERTDDDVRISVRDDGIGFPVQRLTDAAREGRLGVAHSIRARVEGVGGTVHITSAPGQGTELELSVPLSPPAQASAR